MDGKHISPFVTDGEETITVLLEHRADVSSLEGHGAGALEVAVQCQRPEITQLLLMHGADMSKRYRHGEILHFSVGGSLNQNHSFKAFTYFHMD
jgi:hypothetical protein